MQHSTRGYTQNWRALSHLLSGKGAHVAAQCLETVRFTACALLYVGRGRPCFHSVGRTNRSCSRALGVAAHARRRSGKTCNTVRCTMHPKLRRNWTQLPTATRSPTQLALLVQHRHSGGAISFTYSSYRLPSRVTMLVFRTTMASPSQNRAKLWKNVMF